MSNAEHQELISDGTGGGKVEAAPGVDEDEERRRSSEKTQQEEDITVSDDADMSKTSDTEGAVGGIEIDHEKSDEFVIPNMSSSRFHKMPYVESNIEKWTPPGESQTFTPPMKRKVPPPVPKKPCTTGQTLRPVKKYQDSRSESDDNIESEQQEEDVDKEEEEFLFCVGGLERSVDIEKLCYYLSMCSGCDIDEESFLWVSEDYSMAVLKFDSFPDLDHFMKNLKEKTFNKKNPLKLDACPVDKQLCVVASVQGNQNVLLDDIKEYFQNQWSSGGGQIQSLEKLQKGFYKIEFRKTTAAMRVSDLARKHKIGDVPLSVSLLYQCQFGEVWDYSRHKLPPLEVDEIDMEAKKATGTLSRDKEEEILEETIKYEPVIIRLLNREEIVEKASQLFEGLSLVTDIDKCEIKFRGKKDEIQSVQKIFDIQVEEIVTWRIDSWDASFSKEQFSLLITTTVQDLLRKRFLEENLLIDIECSEKMVHFTAKNLSHKTKAQDIISNVIKYSEIPITFESEEYPLKEEWKKTCDRLESQHKDILTISMKSEDSVVVTSVDSIHEAVIEELENVIYYDKDKIPITDEEQMLFLQKHCIHDIQKRFSVKLKAVTGGLELYGTSHGLATAKAEIGEILVRICTELYQIERPRMETVLGSKGKELFLEVEERNKCVVVWKGIKTVKGASDQKDKKLTYSPSKTSEDQEKSAEKWPSGATSVPADEVNILKKEKGQIVCPNGTRITLVKGEISAAKGDVSVCTLNPSLELSKSEAGKSLLQKGKKKLQDRINDRYPRHIKHGDVAVIATGDLLPFKSLFCGALPDWVRGSKDKDKNNAIFINFVKSCITKADEAKYKSIVFTALGTGIHGFPVQNVAKLMYDAVVEYDREHDSSRTAKDIQFMLFHKDIPTITAFEDEEYSQLNPADRTKSYKAFCGPLTMPNNVKVTLVADSVEKQEVDAVVCCADTRLNLRNGDVAKAVLQAGGPEIQEEIKSKYRNGIKYGEVAKVGGKKLACKYLYVTTLPTWSDLGEKLKKDEEKFLYKAVTECLHDASKEKLKSIAFSALGTGQTAYPKGIVAKIMYNCVFMFATQNPDCSVKDVRFVVMAKEEETLKIFKHEEQIQLSPPEVYSSRDGKEIYYTKSGIQVSLETGDLPHIKAEVIVSTVAANLDLAKGLASHSLLQAEGRSLQEQCKQNYPNVIEPGTIVDLTPTKLQCKSIYLTNLLKYNEGTKELEMKLFKFVKKCLEEASMKNMSSVAFPALCTGYNGYPYHRVAALSYEAVKSFAESQESTSIKSVHFVILPKDTRALKAFQREQRKRLSQNFLFKWMVPKESEDNVKSQIKATKEEPKSPEDEAGLITDTTVLSLLIISDSSENIRDAKLGIMELVDDVYRGFQERPLEVEEISDIKELDKEKETLIQIPKDVPINLTKTWVDKFPKNKSSAALKAVIPRIKEELELLYPGLNPTIVLCRKADIAVTLPVFIAYSEEVVQISKESVIGFQVIIRNPRIVDKEGLKARNYEKTQKQKLTQDELNSANKVIKAWSKELWETHSNLSVITVSGVKSRKDGTFEKKVCVVLSCLSKGYIPINEEPFPKILKANNITIDVDVREGFFELGPAIYDTCHSRSFHQRLKIGCSISTEEGPYCGSLGPFVDLGNKKTGFITCAHVLFEIHNDSLDYHHQPNEPKNVLQPAATTSGRNNNVPCGHVVRALFKPDQDVGIDAAVVEITDANREPQEGLFALQDTVQHQSKGFVDMPKFNNGSCCYATSGTITNRKIVKVGSETHLTQGMIASHGIEVRPPEARLCLPNNRHFKVAMKKQIAVDFIGSSFFIPGDSGSGVFVMEDDRTLQCIGIAIGTTTDGQTVVTPIKHVLDALNIRHGLKKFPEEMDM